MSSERSGRRHTTYCTRTERQKENLSNPSTMLECNKRKNTATGITTEEECQRLMDDMAFPNMWADVCARSGDARHLLRLFDEGYKISESDPLLVMLVDPADTVASHYAYSGNYGLPAHVPGRLVWPGGAPPSTGGQLPVGVAMAPPRALGAMIARSPGVEDKSLGLFTVFHVATLGHLHDLPGVVQVPQFVRVGPLIAHSLGIPEEEPLVQFITLDKMTGPPEPYNNFNRTA